MRKLLIAVVLLLGLGVAADFVAARLFESRVTTALQRKYDLGARPIVQVRDFPFLPHLLSGRFTTIDLAADNASARGLKVESLELHLRDVTVPRSVLLGGRGLVRVDRADGRVKLSQAEINRLLAERLQGGSLVLGSDQVRVQVQTEVLGRPLTALVIGRLGVRAGRISFTPQTVQVSGIPDAVLERQLASRFTFDVPMPPLPAGFIVDRLDVEPGAVLLAGHAGGVEVAA
jgi:LmeA-like phospholipid-binding